MSTFVKQVMKDYNANALKIRKYKVDDCYVQIDKLDNTICIYMPVDKQFKLQDLLKTFNDLGYIKIYEVDNFIFLYKETVREVKTLVHCTEGETIEALKGEVSMLTEQLNLYKRANRI